MSRIGRAPIAIPAGVEVTLGANNAVTVKGPKGTLTKTLHPAMTIKKDGNVLTVERAVLLQVVGTGHVDDVALLVKAHRGVELLSQGTLGALDGDDVVVADLHFHAGGELDRHSSDSRHI